MSSLFSFVTLCLLGLSIVEGFTAWARGILLLRDAENEIPNSPEQIWYVAIRGPFLLIGSIVICVFYGLGHIDEAVTCFGLGGLQVPDWVIRHRDELQEPVFGKKKE